MSSNTDKAARLLEELKGLHAKATAACIPAKRNDPYTGGDLNCDEDEDGPITAHCVAAVNAFPLLAAYAEEALAAREMHRSSVTLGAKDGTATFRKWHDARARTDAEVEKLP